ncbi:RNI-like superfamily protein [Raphanus sativus]|nr:RNI-like superfamily protein [Raphanus sativus]
MWVVIALSRCLLELEILYESYPAKPNILPSDLYICKSLVVLKLDGEILLDVPRMVSLPSLKTLQLQRVRYFNEETLQMLLSNCPVLEDLVLGLDEEETTQKLTVVVPSLQSLSLSIPRKHDIYGFVIETPALKYFKLLDYIYKSHYCLVENMLNLIEAHLDVRLHDIKSLIGSIASVKRLEICSKTMLDEGFVFNQLEHLEVCLSTLVFPEQLAWLLQASPNLKRLDISLMDGHLSGGMGNWNQPSTVPECLLSSLQSLSWLKYTGKPQERYCGLHFGTCSSLKVCNNQVNYWIGCSKT